MECRKLLAMASTPVAGLHGYRNIRGKRGTGRWGQASWRACKAATPCEREQTSDDGDVDGDQS
eukprot:450130-Lingulodinium_polyedra.AAC.1